MVTEFKKDFFVIENYLQDKLSAEELLELIAEIRLLSDNINNIFTGHEVYLIFVSDCLSKITDVDDEAALLEVLVPLWDKARGNQLAKDKPIDDFYYEFELYMLWSYLVKLARDNDLDVTKKLRAIVRRYSQMPKLWSYLCQLQGDELTTAYTF